MAVEDTLGEDLGEDLDKDHLVDMSAGAATNTIA